MARNRTKVCSFIDGHGKSCPNLAEPGTSRCAVHPGRPKSQPWSGDRPAWERAQRAKLRAQAIRVHGMTCQRCGATGQDMQLHHVKPISPSTTLDDCLWACVECHRAVDPHAR